MRKLALLMTITVVGLVAGCSTPTPSPTVTPEPTELPTVAPTATTPGTVACRARAFGKVDGLPPVNDQDWVRGPADASITLIEYSDFQ